MGNVKIRLPHVAVALAAIAAAVAPWALGLGRAAGGGSPPGHAAYLVRLGAVAASNSGGAIAAQHAIFTNCGAERDFPQQWTVVGGDDPCPTWGYSFILTSGSDRHFATWSYADIGGLTAPAGKYTVRVWIPSKYAGAVAGFAAQYCGQSTWTSLGTINQNKSTGWTAVPGKLTLSESQPLCLIREQNTGSGTWDLAEDALDIVSS